MNPQEWGFHWSDLESTTESKQRGSRTEVKLHDEVGVCLLHLWVVNIIKGVSYDTTESSFMSRKDDTHYKVNHDQFFALLSLHIHISRKSLQVYSTAEEGKEEMGHSLSAVCMIRFPNIRNKTGKCRRQAPSRYFC